MDRHQLWNRCKSRVASVRQVLTRDFDYSRSDFFFGLDVMMAVGGVRWNTKKSKAKRCWNVYHWMICVPQALILWNAHRNVQDWASLEIILSSLQASLAMLVTVLRMRILLWFYEPLMEVKRYVNRRKFGRDLAQSVGIRSEAFYNVRKIVIRNFPNWQYFCEKAVNIWIVGTSFLAALDFLIIYMVLAGLTAEGKVIALSFSEIFGNTDRRVQEKLESIPGPSRQQAEREKFYFWKYLQEEFNSCIELHIEFLAIKNKIKPTLNASFLITYYSTVVTLACGCIYLSQMKSVTLFSLLTLFYCSWVVIECALLTRLVNLATEANASIGWQVYDLEWPAKLQYEERFRAAYRAVQKAVMTVLAVSRQPLRFNCFGFFEFTQDQFWILLNMTYNLYTFFRNFV
ncbi:hypothetical protein pipiens_008731 [Culex pipiens pipiens]|uniref:Odorant receptor n=1 Tax=Culex pipiens pipiens TaxID=38569 RepID=A0ABD1DGE4_CULPP